MQVARRLRGMVAVGLFVLTIVSTAPAKYSGGAGEPNDPYQIATAADLIAFGETLPGIGAAGDSLTDEYSQRATNYGDASALCWVDLLARLRGPTSTTPELTFGDYQTISMGSPRSRGYTYNWALAGANTATLLSQGQHTGVSSQVRQGLIQYVALFVGTNDFYPAYQALYSQTIPIPGVDGKQYPSAADYANSIVARYTTALDTLSNAGAKVVMATIADHGSLPSWAKDFPEGKKRQHITDATIAVNSQLKILAQERKLPIVDVFELLDLFYVSSTPLYVGGVSILKGVAPAPDGRYAVLPDGFHPGTVWQGLLANTFVEACNRGYGTSFTPLSDGEILTAAGLARLAADSTSFDIKPFVILPTYAKYSGGSGTAQDPYQIATADDLIALGETPADYDKHFKLMADIDLSAYLYDAALVAPDGDPNDPAFQGISFSGIFDGNSHAISNLTIDGEGYLGLFGRTESEAIVENLGLTDVNIVGTDYVSGLVGFNRGSIASSCVTGTIMGSRRVGGLTGRNWGSIAASYNAAAVTGHDDIGGVAAANYGTIMSSYNTGPLAASLDVGGLVGENYGSIVASYSAGLVGGTTRAGGLVGYNYADAGTVTDCLWDVETSGLSISAGGTGKTTVEMQTASTFLDAGWDFVGETENGTEDIWWIDEGKDYPRLWWERQESGPTVKN